MPPASQWYARSGRAKPSHQRRSGHNDSRVKGYDYSSPVSVCCGQTAMEDNPMHLQIRPTPVLRLGSRGTCSSSRADVPRNRFSGIQRPTPHTCLCGCKYEYALGRPALP